jgi:hypothetical protein
MNKLPKRVEKLEATSLASRLSEVVTALAHFSALAPGAAEPSGSKLLRARSPDSSAGRASFTLSHRRGSGDLRANAVGFSAAGVLADNLLRPGSGTLALYGGIGVGTSEGEAAGRAGMSFGW